MLTYKLVKSLLQGENQWKKLGLPTAIQIIETML